MPQRYLKQAEDAERLARTAPTEAERDAYQKIAALWRDLAQRGAAKPT